MTRLVEAFTIVAIVATAYYWFVTIQFLPIDGALKAVGSVAVVIAALLAARFVHRFRVAHPAAREPSAAHALTIIAIVPIAWFWFVTIQMLPIDGGLKSIGSLVVVIVALLAARFVHRLGTTPR